MSAAVHMPMIPGQTPLCRQYGCGVLLALDDDGRIRRDWVTCRNCLRIEERMRCEDGPPGRMVLA